MPTRYNKLWNLRESLRNLFWRGKRKENDAVALFDALRTFCRAESSTMVIGKDGRVDALASAALEGRREVYLWLQARLNMTDEQIRLLTEDKEKDQ